MPLLQIDPSPQGRQPGQLWVQFLRGPKVSQRPIKLAASVVASPAFGIRRSVYRVTRNRLAKVGKCALVVAALGTKGSLDLEFDRGPRISPQSIGKFAEGAVAIALLKAILGADSANLRDQALEIGRQHDAMETERIGLVLEFPIAAILTINVIEPEGGGNKDIVAEIPSNVGDHHGAIGQLDETCIVTIAAWLRSIGHEIDLQSLRRQPDRVAQHEIEQRNPLAARFFVSDHVAQLMPDAIVLWICWPDLLLDNAREVVGDLYFNVCPLIRRKFTSLVLIACFVEFLRQRDEVPVVNHCYDPGNVIAVFQRLDLLLDPLFQRVDGRLRLLIGGRKVKLAQ